MQRTGLILSTVLLFLLSLYVAYEQGYTYQGNFLDNSALTITQGSPMVSILSNFQSGLLSGFAWVIAGLSNVFGGSILASVIILALVVELATLYPAVNIQLKQKKIHLFHKKLVDRFRSGELALSKAKHELDLIYSVNEKMHRRGAALVVFQVIAFAAVFAGLYFLAKNPGLLGGSFNSFTFAILAKPVSVYLPIMTALAYLLHALIKIHVKQQQDHVDATQINIALSFAILITVMAFFFAASFATLVSIYFMTQITFATMRYLIVEEKTKSWAKFGQKQMIKMLQTAEAHKSKVEHVSRRFNHLAPVRHLNLHLLEEGISMSMALVMAITLMN